VELEKRFSTSKSQSSGGGTVVIRIDLASSSASIVVDALERAKEVFETDDQTTALACLVTEWFSMSSNSPGKVPASNMVALLERVYGGTFVYQDDAEVVEDYEDDEETTEDYEDEEEEPADEEIVKATPPARMVARGKRVK
jgi:predicted FMN-binding regulatory protein PaiB